MRLFTGIDLPVDNHMRPQMFARGQIKTAEHRDTVLIPKDAVIFDPMKQSASVFLAKDGKAVKNTLGK